MSRRKPWLGRFQLSLALGTLRRADGTQGGPTWSEGVRFSFSPGVSSQQSWAVPRAEQEKGLLTEARAGVLQGKGTWLSHHQHPPEHLWFSLLLAFSTEGR